MGVSWYLRLYASRASSHLFNFSYQLSCKPQQLVFTQTVPTEQMLHDADTRMFVYVCTQTVPTEQMLHDADTRMFVYVCMCMCSPQTGVIHPIWHHFPIF